MPRLHKSSWVVATLALVVCVLICVPGQILDSHLAPYPNYLHGWPLTFLVRDVDDVPEVNVDGKLWKMSASWAIIQPPPGPPWLSWDSWRLWHAEETNWKPLNLVFDLAVVMAIVAMVTVLWEFRRRRRENAFQFRLSDFFVATAVLAVGCYWLHNHRSNYDAEQRAIDYLTTLNESRIYASRYGSEVNHAPAWLQRLVGPGYILDYFIRSHSATLYNVGQLDSEEIESIVHRLSQFECLESVDLSNPPEFAETEALLRAAIQANLPQVKFEE